MGLKEDILEASKRVRLNPYKQAFKPSDLGLTSSDYGSFADYCSKDDALSGHWSSKIILKVAERNANGKPHKYFLIDNIFDSKNKNKKEESTPKAGKLNKEQIQKLYEEYMKILELEVNVLGLKPTEVRHLIGRIGEFECALLTNGKLSYEVNQHGFDVISNGKKISVKTTAQNSGFIAINKNTVDKVDDLMILQYIGHEFKIIYYGDINKAISQARTWNNKFELDISKAKKLKSKNT